LGPHPFLFAGENSPDACKIKQKINGYAGFLPVNNL
jgi:hypothetical protein